MPDTPPPGPAPTPRRPGWFKASRGDDPLTLIRRHPLAYLLAAVVAHRARWNPSTPNPHRLELGEAFIGDYWNHGMTEREYRTAKATLAAKGKATFKPTNKGTIARLCDSTLFDVLVTASDEQNPLDEATNKTTGRATNTTTGRATNKTHFENTAAQTLPNDNGAHATNKRTGQTTGRATGKATTNEELKEPQELQELSHAERQSEFTPLTTTNDSQPSGPSGPVRGADSSNGKARKAKPEELRAYREFRQAWDTAYRECNSFDYLFSGAKDAQGIKRILASKLSVPELIAIARREWSTPSSTFNRDMAASIAGFASRLNEIRAGQARPAGRNGQPATAPNHEAGF